MKMTHYLLMVLAFGVLGLVGCGKSEESKPPILIPGAVNLSGIQQAFPAPTPEISRSLDKLRLAIRYHTLDAALVELAKLAALPNLTDPQKKAINDVTDQVKVAIKSLPPKPAQ
jgi:hypothetical protein